MMSKKINGQFYTVMKDYILKDFTVPKNVDIVEPFVGKGDLVDWIRETDKNSTIEMYDIDPKFCETKSVKIQDTLLNPPNYNNKWIITNPPYLARNKSENKIVFDKYNTNDLYKCFIHSVSLQDGIGGIFIIPSGFFFSPRDVDFKCRDAFLSKYKLTSVRYFEETVFPDTPTTVIAISFEKGKEIMDKQDVEWTILPRNEKRVFCLERKNGWIIGGDVYELSIPKDIKIKRYVEGNTLGESEQLTNLTISALDSGREDGKIKLEYKKGYVYPAKDTSRTYATLCIRGKFLSEEEQRELAYQFNTFLNKKRDELWSLFLPQYRESKEYARKRIPFELVYRIVLHLIFLNQSI